MKKLLLALALVASSFPAWAGCDRARDSGLLTYNVIAAASDNHAVIFASPGVVCHLSLSNANAAPQYIRLYNATTGFNGCNSATNMIGYWPIPASTAIGGREIPLPWGLGFSTGISICITGGAGFTNTTNASTDVSVLVGYAAR